MRTFTVHANAAIPNEDDRVRFVKEGMAWWALLFPLFWFLYHRLWWEAAVFFGLSLVIALGGEAIDLGENLTAVASLLLQALAAAEANDLRRLALARKGYRPIAIVQGRNMDDAELRFFDGWTGSLPQPVAVPATSAVFDRRGENQVAPATADAVWPKAAPAVPAATAQPGDVLGLFPRPHGQE